MSAYPSSYPLVAHYKHCEYQSLLYLHVVPEAQTLHPVYVRPPHWPQRATVQPFPPLGLVVIAPPGLDVVPRTVDVEDTGDTEDVVAYLAATISACTEFSVASDG